jgi:hypothetical protein
MSARSSALELAALLAVVAGCGKKEPPRPEADPAKFVDVAKAMYRNSPVPGMRACEYKELLNGATLTARTLGQIAGVTPSTKDPGLDEYVNPMELDAPAARELVDSKDDQVRRRATAELLAAPFYLVYHVDLVDTPLVLGVKDFKRGYVGARALRYDKGGNLSCVFVFYWTNDPVKQAWAIEKTDHPLVAPEVQKAMQDDLKDQMLKRVAGLAATPPPRPEGVPADDRSERN